MKSRSHITALDGRWREGVKGKMLMRCLGLFCPHLSGEHFANTFYEKCICLYEGIHSEL